MPLLPPTRARNRSKLADWMELSALISPTGAVHSNEIRRLIESDSDGDDHGTDVDPSTGEALDREILDHGPIDVIERLHEELEYRARVCGECYPFALEYSDGPAGFDGTFRLRCLINEPIPTSHHTFYTLCLLETGIRDQIVAVSDVNVTNHRLGLLFQVASCLALGGYFRGHIVWFGFPRPDANAFLPALRSVFERYGSHTVLDRIPAGYPRDLKDGGIDIIAWIDFEDGRGAKSVIYGQVASGYDWPHKTLLGFIAKFQNWFLPPAIAHASPAILIPFPIHHGLEENDERHWETEAQQSMLYHSSDFGVIFDRFRVARFAARACVLPEVEQARIDGFAQLDSITEWIGDVLGQLAPSEAA